MKDNINKETLGRNTFWSVAGHVTNGVGRMLLFVMAAKFFSPEETGVFFWSLAVATPLIYFFNLELRLSYVTDSSGKYTAGDTLGLRILGSSCAMLLLVGFALFMGFSDGPLTGWLLILCGLTRAIEGYADSYIGVMQKKEKMSQAAVSFALRTMIILAMIMLVGHNHWPIWTIPLIWILAVVIVNRGYEVKISRSLAEMQVRFDRDRLIQLFRESLPLGVFMAVATLSTESGKYFIRHFLTDADVAYYTIAITIINGTMMAQNGINQGVLRRMSIYFQIDRGEFLTLLYRILAIATGLMLFVIVVFWLFGRELISTIIRPEYSENLFDKGPVLMIMLFGGMLIIWAMVIGDAVVACRAFTRRMTSMAISLVINLFLCYYLVAVRKMQLAGIAWAFTGSAAANLIINLYYLIRLLETKNHDRRQEENYSGNPDIV